jgi:hypothetical protein
MRTNDTFVLRDFILLLKLCDAHGRALGSDEKVYKLIFRPGFCYIEFDG